MNPRAGATLIKVRESYKPLKNFSFLQLYYPLIYLRSIIEESKPIRTIFIDITTTQDREAYRLLEVHFRDEMFDEVEVFSACEY